MSSAMPQPETSPIVACTVSRDVQNFDLLIEDMETVLGENWGDLRFEEALAFFGQPDAEALEFIAMAMDSSDEDNLVLMSQIIAEAKKRAIKVILIAEDVTPAALHQLLRKGADEFIPYPLPENELKLAVERLRAPAEAPSRGQGGGTHLKSGEHKQGALFVVHGLAGGVGASTIATNLAWELANLGGDKAPKVCLLDLDLQFGAVSTYLDLPRRDVVFEMLSDTENMDDEIFGQALMPFEDRLSVLTAPSDIIPLDLLSSEDVKRIIEMARKHFDFVVIDMPSTIVQWTETVLQASHVYFGVLELDMRSAQNALRLKRALQSEDLPFNKVRFALNHAPGFTDLSGKSRVKRMGESLGISIDLLLSDGGKQVMQACDHGLPLSNSAPKNPLRKDIVKLAASLFQVTHSDAEAA